ncbi:MAG: 4-hydroxyphenylpyruvate dioxygenase [Fibrobacteres bacterium]|nr:4-hydroxyphenylpyruvate dioxygenase [Fibrobacterota bacterium]
MADDIRIKRVHHVEFWVGNAKQAEYFYRNAFGFSRSAYSGLETGARDRAAYALRAGQAAFVVACPYGDEGEAGRMGEHLKKHGDGVRDIALEVEDAAQAFAAAVARGAEPAFPPMTLTDEHGTAVRAGIKAYGDIVHSFISLKDYRGPFLPGFQAAPMSGPDAARANGRDAGLVALDHYVANVRLGEMAKWEAWYERVLGLQRFMTFDDKDISTEFTALNSVVMANASRSLKFPINEPAPGRKKSQVEEYNDFHHGPGVQHIALLTADILKTVSALRANGVGFLAVPESYYQALPGRVGPIDEAIPALRELGILVDRDDQGYLLQIFTQPLEDRPTLFFEIIQRKGCQGFGKGNFKALFEAIEREQDRRGNLV